MLRPFTVRPLAARTFAAAVFTTVVSACGGESSKAPVAQAPNPSSVKAPGVPIKFSRARFGPIQCEAQVDRPAIRMGPDIRTLDRELRIDSGGALGIAQVERAGRRHLVVAEVGAGNRLVLTRFHDLDGDGYPDADSRRELLTSGDVPMFVVGVAVRSSAVLYLADARCGDIVVAVDGDGDGWVDRLKPRRFARSDDLSDITLVDVAYVHDAATGARLVYAVHEFGREIARLTHPYKILKDADGDDVAESADDVIPRDLRPIVQKGALTEGETQIAVIRDPGSGAAVYEAWLLGALDADVEKLGEVAFEPRVANGVLVTKRPLVARSRVAIRRGADKTTEVRFDVHPAWPTAESVTPNVVAPGAEVELTIRGARFSSDMSVRLLRVGTSESLAFVLIDATTATVSVKLGPDDSDFGLAVVGRGQSMENPLVPVQAVDVRVRRP